ncbi:MAG: glycosyltransferase family 39 protein [Woeseiaceae bacterium]
MSINPRMLSILAATALFAIAVGLRLGAVNATEVQNPIRADAADYYTYAVNLKKHRTYSRATISDTAPVPDAVRSPGYPVFLTMFVEDPPTQFMLWRIVAAQALLDSLTVLLALAIFRRFLPEGLALGAGLLTALSPHLISASTYLLTETLFVFLTTLSIWLLIKLFVDQNRVVAIAAGAIIAAATLTRPTLQFFIIPAAGILYFVLARRDRLRLITPLLVGFVLVVSPWVIRNLGPIGSPTDPILSTLSLQHGMYPDFRYQDIPESTGIPYRYDPRSDEITESKGTVLREIGRRFSEEPVRHLEWYLLKKPITLLSWNIIAGAGGIFIYPVNSSPYLSQATYINTYIGMKALHWPLVILALFATVMIWTPVAKGLPANTLFATRLLSLLMLYFLSLHVIVAPYPRYGIPLRPAIYGLALFQCWWIFTWLKHLLRAPPAANLA